MTLHKILVIEDDPAIGQSLLDGFRTHGFEPHLCNAGMSVVEYAGNGLGLAIVKAILEAHDGEVSVLSNGVGKGSEFVITLPLA